MFQHSILFDSELCSFKLTVWHKRELWNVFLLCGLAPSLLPPQERGWQCAWVRLGKNHDTITLRGGFICFLLAVARFLLTVANFLNEVGSSQVAVAGFLSAVTGFLLAVTNFLLGVESFLLAVANFLRAIGSFLCEVAYFLVAVTSFLLEVGYFLPAVASFLKIRENTLLGGYPGFYVNGRIFRIFAFVKRVLAIILSVCCLISGISANSLLHTPHHVSVDHFTHSDNFFDQGISVSLSFHVDSDGKTESTSLKDAIVQKHSSCPQLVATCSSGYKLFNLTPTYFLTPIEDVVFSILFDRAVLFPFHSFW